MSNQTDFVEPFSFSKTVTEIQARADSATANVERECASTFKMIPAEYHSDISHLIRMVFYQGYGAGCTVAGELVKGELAK
jgi:hypothetical protein